jgi:multiple sugar transport system ATP-binding protein
MVFQSYALYPHLSVYDNIAFSLKLKRMNKGEIDRRVHEAARLLGLEAYLDRKPRALSGGQRQRVAMGRAIVREPAAFLMDEPLSNLDAKLRVQTRAEIKKLQDDLGTTTIYVTHDQVEAMTMGDRVAVMRKGELQQVAAPQELYDKPVNLFVGGFIGSPAMNLVEARLERSDGTLTAVAGAQRIGLGDETLSARPALKDYEGKDVILGIRPEDLEDAELEPDRGQTLEGEVELTEALGSEIMAHFSIDAPPAITDEVRELQEDAGADEDAPGAPTQEEGGRTIMVGRFGARSKATKGEKIRVAVDTRALHFFDPGTGMGIYDGSEREGARG